MSNKRAAKNADDQHDDGAVVVLPADCRMAAQADLHAQLLEAAKAGGVQLDGNEVERVDTAALQQLLLLQRELHGGGGALVWRGASVALHEAASLLGLATILELPAVASA